MSGQAVDSSLTPLRFFLQKSMLSTDTESEEADDKVPVSTRSGAQLTPQKVTMSTVHAAKGLEWPVVFIPAGETLYSCVASCLHPAEQDTFPSYRCVEEHEIAEERRLLYVAMTRAQVFLVGLTVNLTSPQTLTRAHYRMAGGDEKERHLSEFVAASMRKDPVSLLCCVRWPADEAGHLHEHDS